MEGQEHQQTAKEEEEILPAISSLRRCHSDIFKNETMTLVLFFFQYISQYGWPNLDVKHYA